MSYFYFDQMFRTAVSGINGTSVMPTIIQIASAILLATLLFNVYSNIYFHTRFKPGTVDVSQGAQFEIDCTINLHTVGVYDVKRLWLVWPARPRERDRGPPERLE